VGCPHPCNTCDSNGICITCANALRPTAPNCDCAPGYYNVGLNPVC